MSHSLLSRGLFSILLSAASVNAQTSAPKEPPECSVRGQVIHDPGGHPLKKANIELHPEDKETGTNYKAISDIEGRFKFENVEPGDYSLTLERNGFLESGKRHTSHTLTLAPRPGNQRHAPAYAACRGNHGEVLDSDGDPVPHVGVVVSKYGSSSSRRGFVGEGGTNDLGEFRIGNLRSGRYLIKAIP